MRVKVERVSEHIWTVRAWAFIPIRVWLVRETRGVTLVDAGIPTMAKGILRTIARIDAGPLQRIILTHGHADHVGAINRIVGTDRSVGNAPVPVYAHRIEIPYIEGTVAYPGRTKAQSSVAKGLVEPLREGEDGMLQSVAGMKPYLTPGHSPGHVVYYHEQDQVLIGGDCLMSRRGQPRRPMAMFTGDMEEALRSAEIVRRLRPVRLEVAHAGPVLHPADKLDALLGSGGMTTKHQGARWAKRKGSA